jgi:hypothetical protein
MLRVYSAYLVVCGLAALVAFAVLTYLGDTRGAIAAGMITASALMLLGGRTFASPPPRRHWVALGLIALATMILGFPIGMVAGSLAVLMVLQLLVNAVSAHQLGGMTLETLDHPAVMPGAEGFVQEFAAQGFGVIGSYGFHLAGRPVVMTTMLGPTRDRLVVVTDKVLTVSSRFGRRSLLTTNSATAPLPSEVLRQHVAGANPGELVHAHDAALTLLDRHACRPDVFESDTEALHAVREMEERALAFVGRVSLRTALRIETTSPSQTSVLGSDADSLSRIASWLGQTA